MALAEADATLADVVRTRQFIVHPEDAEAVGKYAAAFGEVRPASTMVVVAALLERAGGWRSRPRRSSGASPRRTGGEPARLAPAAR